MTSSLVKHLIRLLSSIRKDESERIKSLACEDDYI